MFSFIIIRRQSGALNISAILYIHIQSNQRKLKRNTTYTLTIRSKIFEIRRWFSSAQTKKSVLSDRARLLFDLFHAYCTKITISIIKMLMILAVKSTEFRFVVFKISRRIQPLSCKIHLTCGFARADFRHRFFIHVSPANFEHNYSCRNGRQNSRNSVAGFWIAFRNLKHVASAECCFKSRLCAPVHGCMPHVQRSLTEQSCV